MAVLEDLSEEEAYLWAILSDPSGLDHAEFLWTDAEQDDNCFRAWDFQVPWWRCMDGNQIEQSARSVGKSLSIQARGCAFPFIHPGQEMVITAPEANHLDAVTDNIETKLNSIRLTREMLVGSGGRGGIKHRPFHVNFQNGARIMGRIPQRDGRGVKGIHPVWLELDEAQDFPRDGWVEIFATVKQGSEGAMWRAHGVTRGERDYFFKFTQEGSGWTIHRITAMHRPTWTAEERAAEIKKYSSVDHPDYRRNILGEHGDATSPLFVLHRLMQCFQPVGEDDQTALQKKKILDGRMDVNDQYSLIKITHESLEDVGGDIELLLDLPYSHTEYRKAKTWIGMDVGWTHDPSEVLVFLETGDVLNLITRIQMQRIGAPEQLEAILFLMQFYNPEVFALDATGAGLPLYQFLQDGVRKNPNLQWALDKIRGYNFASKIIVDLDDKIEVDEFLDDPISKAKIEKNVKEHASDKLRELVDQKRLWMPFDAELREEFQGESFTVQKGSGMDLYGRRKIFGNDSLHALDAARMAILAWSQHHIEAFINQDRQPEVLDVAISLDI